MWRQEKINSLMRQFAGTYLAKKIRGSLITIIRIETSKDLKLAKIFISIFPESKEKETLNILKEKTGELRKYIGSQIKMKFLPQLSFEIDNRGRAERKIEEILGHVAK